MTFEDELRERLTRRADAVDPIADVDDLDTRIRVDRRRRAQMTAVAGGLGLVALIAVASVVANDDDGSGVNALDGGSDRPFVTTTSTPPLTMTTIDPTPVTEPPFVGPGETPGSTVAVPGGEVPLETKLLLEEMLDILYEPGAADVARLDRLIGTDGIKTLFDRIRSHPLGPDIETLRASIASVGINPDNGIAGMNVAFTSTDQGKYPGTLTVYVEAELVNGSWKMPRWAFCSSVVAISNAVGADITCDDGEPPVTTTTTSTTVPTESTTTSLAPTTTLP